MSDRIARDSDDRSDEMGPVRLALMLVKIFVILVGLRLLGARSADLFEQGSEPY